VIETWVDYKRKREVDAIRLRPHPHECHLYYDIQSSACSAEDRARGPVDLDRRLTEDPLSFAIRILWSIASTECGEIASSANPGSSGDDTDREVMPINQIVYHLPSDHARLRKIGSPRLLA